MEQINQIKHYGYITFKSVSYAMKFESALKNQEVKIKIIPVPRSISSSCGFCVRFDLDILDMLMNVIKGNNLEYEKIYTNL
jgi:hypothetical protein